MGLRVADANVRAAIGDIARLAGGAIKGAACGDDRVDAFGAEDLVKAGDELRVAVADQEPDVLERAGDAEVAGLLGDPPAVRGGGRGREVDAADLTR
jgi:hypothetical protein